MSRFRYYFTPFETADVYGDEVEVTDFVKADSINRLRQQVDNSEFDVGIFKFSDSDITLNNQKGHFSLPSEPNTIFNHTRTNSKVRITWEIEDYIVECGIAECGARKLSDPVTVFEGILNDDASRSQVDSQHISFKILGREAIFDLVDAPTASFNIGDTFKEVIEACLAQTIITDLFNVDTLNINLPVNLTLDAVDQWDDATVKEVFDDLL
ncbi:hypothetical protein KAU11_07440, partial [Candidatus Babeliales bacterium]|nr:hypothetical protein [Candidatus Babeliales bacterium]